MLSTLICGLATLSIVYSHGDGDDHDHDHAECECITGWTEEDVEQDCSSSKAGKFIEGLQDFMVKNQCLQYCANKEYTGTDEKGFRCFQAFSLLNAYHDFCPSGSVNETLNHQYLDKCPDCHFHHYFVEGAPNCTEGLSCEDKAAQNAAIKEAETNCLEKPGCESESCTKTLVTVETYHRVCPHSDLAEMFDTVFESELCQRAECKFHCNVVEKEEHDVNCSAEGNFGDAFGSYGKVDLKEHLMIDLDGDDAASHLTGLFSVVISGVLGLLAMQ